MRLTGSTGNRTGNGLCCAAILGLALMACQESPHGATLTGRAMLAGYYDHSGIRLQLNRIDRQAETDTFGYFVMEHLPVGDYILEASHPGTIERFVTARVRVDSGADSAGPRVFLSLRAASRVVGMVQDSAGRPVGGAQLSVLGHEETALTDETGIFRLDPAPAGRFRLQASATGLEPDVLSIDVAAGGEAVADFSLMPRSGPDPYRQNRLPRVADLRLRPVASQNNPTVVPLPASDSDRVRRGALYELSLTAEDPDGDTIQVFCSADRGTLTASTATLDAQGRYRTTWTAGLGTNTIVCTALDPFGGLTNIRLVVDSSGDSARGAVHYNGSILFSESSDENFDLFAWNPGGSAPQRLTDDALDQHGIARHGRYVVHGNSEFLFISPLTYRVMVRDMQDPEATRATYEFGQSFDHDAVFLIRFDLYSPLSGPFLPYRSLDATLAPLGYGYLDLATGRPVAAFVGQPAPASLGSFSRRGTTDLWLDRTGRLLLRRGGNTRELANFDGAALPPQDVQLDDRHGAVLLPDGKLHLVDLTSGAMSLVGFEVTSFALASGRIAYADRGPNATAIYLRDLLNNDGADRRISDEPRYERRVWYLDDAVLIYGDQGQPGEALVRLNSELLWVYFLSP